MQMKLTRIGQAAKRAGIATHYVNIQGETTQIADTNLAQILRILQQSSPTDASSSPLPPVLLFRQNAPYILPGKLSGQWQLQLEDGSQQQGELQDRARARLPGPLPLGYHQLTLFSRNEHWQCRLIIAPSRCFEPAPLLAGDKLWGACIQLYTLRSADNWGVGDFGDLQRLLCWLAARGAAFVGLNPIHALYPATPEQASPYSPSSRRWLNIIYIDVAAVEEFQHSPQAQQWWRQEQTQTALHHARQCDAVDYSAVMALKLAALDLAFDQFNTLDDQHPRQLAFNVFLQQGGESLQRQALFDAVQASLEIEDQRQHQGWLSWPQDLQGDVAALCQQHERKTRFYAWLQWLADQQLAQCYDCSQQQHMPIGLYRDLAVGVTRGSAETWSNSGLYCLDASIGAPPDPLGPQGQNWQLPPFNPHVLREHGYQPFIDLLRANMRSCGALRIDHVMALQRLWWIPGQESAAQGAYVLYPVDDLLGILALESQRHRCMVIGEDLGTVPTEIVDKLQQNGVYSYKVLYFEHDQRYRFRMPDHYPVQALATLTTHDLPTLYGYWQATDLQLGQQLGLYRDAEQLRQLKKERHASKRGLLKALIAGGYWPKLPTGQRRIPLMSEALSQAIQRYLADSRSALLGLQIEEWLQMMMPVNIPGTDTQYHNWRRKLSATLEELQQNSELMRQLEQLRQTKTTNYAQDPTIRR